MIPDTIMVVPDAYSKEECEDIINIIPIVEERFVYNSESQEPILVMEVNAPERQDKQWDGKIVFGSFNNYPLYFNKLGYVLREGVKAYGQKFPIIKDFFLDQCNVSFDGFKIQKTSRSGGFHKWHFEDGLIRDRFLTWSVFLNNVEEGGETEFLYQSARVPAKQGSLCLFPSDWTHTHRGNPPISNEKWIMTGWIVFTPKNPLFIV
tara:strand:+ start:558 stop:1175 length:618 start_codon:yes stop_codon:yes gene_type:complete